MQKAYVFNSRVAWWFLLLIPLVFFGFYRSYFSILLSPRSSLIHFHFGLMAAWTIVLIVQPFLFKYKKLALHRTVGKMTYVLMPVLLVTAFFVVRFSYFNVLDRANRYVTPEGTHLSHQEVLQEGASEEAIAFLYLAWLILFYCLAIANRKRSSIHARYMIAAALTMLGPTVDRIVVWLFPSGTVAGFISYESFSFIIEDIILATVLLSDYKNRRSVKPALFALCVFASTQVIYFLAKGSHPWERVVTAIMQPG